MTQQKFLFADRDGTLNFDPGYISDINKFEFVKGAIDFLRIFQRFGYKFVIVTNQGGVAKGMFTKFESIHFSRHVVNQLALEGIVVEEVFSCFHHPDGVFDNFAGPCSCRKPKPGLFYMAERKFNIDKSKSVVLGNKLSDIKAGMSFGLKTGFLIGEDSQSKTILKYQNTLTKNQVCNVALNYCHLSKHAEKFLEG